MYQYIKFPWSIDIYRLSTILDWPTGPGPTSSCPSMTARCKAVTPLGPLPRGSARAVTRAWPRVDGDVPTGKVKHIIDSMNIIIYICINININILYIHIYIYHDEKSVALLQFYWFLNISHVFIFQTPARETMFCCSLSGNAWWSQFWTIIPFYEMKQ
jgi:hypothetical protein